MTASAADGFGLERVGNIHVHSVASDGSGTHAEIAQAAGAAGLDFVAVTDHNTYRPEFEGWYGQVLLLVGEELNDPTRPHVNHLLALGAGRELVEWAGDPVALIAAVNAAGGLAYIAHPIEHSGAIAQEPEINWVDWQVRSYHGLELWNYMSEFKAHVTTVLRAIHAAFRPQDVILGPFAETLRLWDDLLAAQTVYVIGGADAHAGVHRLGPLRKRVFPYMHLFRAVNTHILLNALWSGDASADGRLVLGALRAGRCFVAYDALESARGFRFWLEDDLGAHPMGSVLVTHGRARLRVAAPARARLRLVLNGFCVAEAHAAELEHVVAAPGAYRVEALRRWHGHWRGWIYANPIVVQRLKGVRDQSQDKVVTAR